MLATLIPLFDHTMSVCAYSVFAQKENYLLIPECLVWGVMTELPMWSVLN